MPRTLSQLDSMVSFIWGKITQGLPGSGTVTQFTFHDANGFAGSVSNSTTTPQLTISLDGTVVVTLTGTQTLTNKRITKRAVSMADATSFTPNGDTSDMAYQPNTQIIGTLTANAPTGTPTNGQELWIRIKSTNVQTFAWNAIYAGTVTNPLPTATTGATKTDYFMFKYNTTSSKWVLQIANFGE